MSKKILFKRGAVSNIPTLDVGEPFLATDTGAPKVYVGHSGGNVELAQKAEVDSQLADIAQDVSELQNTGVDTIARGRLDVVEETVTLNIKDYGAVGNGVADDTAALVAAVTAAKGRPVIIPAGTYNVNTPSISNLPVYLVGVGSPVIQLKSTATYQQCLLLTNPPSVKLYDLIFDGDRDARELTFDLACIWGASCKNVDIARCTFRKCSREAISLSGTNENVNIHDCVFDTTSALFYIAAGTIDGLRFVHNKAKTGRGYGVEINSHIDGSKDIFVADNVFTDLTSAAVMLKNVSKVRIHGNIANGTTDNLVQFNLPSPELTEGYSVHDVHIYGNKCKVSRFITMNNSTNGHKHYDDVLIEENTNDGVYGYALRCANKIVCRHNAIKNTSALHTFTNIADLTLAQESPIDMSTIAQTVLAIQGVDTLRMEDIYIDSQNKPWSVTGDVYPYMYFKRVALKYGLLTTTDTFTDKVMEAVDGRDLYYLGQNAIYNPDDSSLTLPPFGPNIKVQTGMTTASSITSIVAQCPYNGKRVLCATPAYNVTLVHGNNIATKTKGNVTYSSGTMFCLTYYNGKWYET